MTQQPGEPAASFEVERKYRVDDWQLIPTAEQFATVGLRRSDEGIRSLEAEYFDTPEFALASSRIAVRRRTGGPDSGWHLKRREAAGVRELHWPLSDGMPDGLRLELVDRLGEPDARRLQCIARLRTQRTVHLLLDARGVAVVELVDDAVEAVNEVSGLVKHWREWEAELLPGAAEALLNAVEPLLLAAGGVPSVGTSKIQRAMRGSG